MAQKIFLHGIDTTFYATLNLMDRLVHIVCVSEGDRYQVDRLDDWRQYFSQRRIHHNGQLKADRKGDNTQSYEVVKPRMTIELMKCKLNAKLYKIVFQCHIIIITV